jgi:hypothetical protein
MNFRLRARHVFLVAALVPVVIRGQDRLDPRWVLPVPDGGGVKPLPPSVHGYIARVTKGRIEVVPDSRRRRAGLAVPLRLASRTDFFSAYGGPYDREDLRAGQYVWVWYITADPGKAGVPPDAAVVMMWSKDPDDKPSEDVRWSFDRAK